MKQQIRKNEPDSFFKGDKKIEFYKNLREGNGKIKDRWNSPTYQNDLHQTLLEMSEEECSYCGIKISHSSLEIDHYLPSSKFPYLSYCFENYLASCHTCNSRKKRNEFPKSLLSQQDILGEAILVGQIENIVAYNKSELLPKTNDRIIEPSFDRINEHLEFDPSLGIYKTKTEIGRNTNRLFFEHREVTIHLQKLSLNVFKKIEEGSSKESILDWGNLYGESYYIESFYEYWIQFQTIF